MVRIVGGTQQCEAGGGAACCESGSSSGYSERTVVQKNGQLYMVRD